MLSEVVYTSLVLAGRTTLDPAAFRRVEVSVKDFRGHGWLWVPNGDVHALRLDPPAAPPTPVVQRPTATGGIAVQAGRDARVPLQRADAGQDFDRNDQRGAHFGPVHRTGGEAADAMGGT